MMGISGQVLATRTAMPEEEEEVGAEAEAEAGVVGVEGVAIVEAEAEAEARRNESRAGLLLVSVIKRDVRGDVHVLVTRDSGDVG